MLQSVRRRTWAPRGQTPIQKVWGRHDRLSVIAALTVSPRRQRLGLYFRIQDHNIRADHVMAFLKELRRHLRRNTILVMDRWSVHRTVARRLRQGRFTWATVEWLPSYAPELNPVEQVWSHTKCADLANYIPDDIDKLRREVERSIQRKRSRRSLLRSFFQHARLDL